MKSYTFAVIIEKERDDPGYHAWCPALPGCVTCGESLDETRENMKEAMAGYLECLLSQGQEIPADVETVVASVTVALEVEIAA